MPLPKDNDEFLEILELYKAAKPEAWVSEDESFRRSSVVQFLFLSMIWRSLEDPMRSCASAESLELAASNRDSRFPSPESEVSEILERMVEAGIEPEEISKLICFKQQDVILHLLYALDDPSYAQYSQVKEDLRFGLYEFDEVGKVITGSAVTDLDHRFYDAVPERYAALVPKAYRDD